MIAIVAIALLAVQVVLLWNVYNSILALRDDLRKFKRLAKRNQSTPEHARLDAALSETDIRATPPVWRSWREGARPSDELKSPAPPE
jgi:hypothetical protein